VVARNSPLVSIVTPVFNNREHFAECIESILAQTYQHWEYTIVDNCSTDGSSEIARMYSSKDSRIRVCRNRELLRAIPNHNVALRHICPESKYCKMVFADDWIFPRCLEEMVALGEEYPSVGIVGAYGLQGHEVMWSGLPYPSNRVSGREVCRRLFLEETYVFGTANSLLYRSDLVRSHDRFFNERNLHADMEACVMLLKSCDFGFVHQVLTYKRCRPQSLGALSDDINTLIAGHLYNLVKHGKEFLSTEEHDACLKRRLVQYYNFLAVNLLKGRVDKRFWNYHIQKLSEAEVGLSQLRLASAVFTRLINGLINPSQSIEKVRNAKRIRTQEIV
jgi:glycosyltransferase involved in cell wall biosynthesis